MRDEDLNTGKNPWPTTAEGVSGEEDEMMGGGVSPEATAAAAAKKKRNKSSIDEAEKDDKRASSSNGGQGALATKAFLMGGVVSGIVVSVLPGLL